MSAPTHSYLYKVRNCDTSKSDRKCNGSVTSERTEKRIGIIQRSWAWRSGKPKSIRQKETHRKRMASKQRKEEVESHKSGEWEEILRNETNKRSGKVCLPHSNLDHATMLRRRKVRGKCERFCCHFLVLQRKPCTHTHDAFTVNYGGFWGAWWKSSTFWWLSYILAVLQQTKVKRKSIVCITERMRGNHHRWCWHDDLYLPYYFNTNRYFYAHTVFIYSRSTHTETETHTRVYSTLTHTHSEALP